LKRGFDHDGLRDLAKERFGVASMSEMNVTQLLDLYKGWTGKGFVRKGKLPERGVVETAMVSGRDLDTLELEFAERGWGKDTQEAFIRRQLRGRVEIRTRADFSRVFYGIRAMNKRVKK
jgi:hypothetical protein